MNYDDIFHCPVHSQDGEIDSECDDCLRHCDEEKGYWGNYFGWKPGKDLSHWGEFYGWTKHSEDF